ncbi:hypothetical protein [Fibrella aquatica]
MWTALVILFVYIIAILWIMDEPVVSQGSMTVDSLTELQTSDLSSGANA